MENEVHVSQSQDRYNVHIKSCGQIFITTNHDAGALSDAMSPAGLGDLSKLFMGCNPHR